MHGYYGIVMVEYVNVKIPTEISDEIDEIVKLRLKGYRNRGEFVMDAIRTFLKPFEELIENRFQHINVFEDHVTILDRIKNSLVDVYFRNGKPYCEYDKSFDCEHIIFALNIPEVREDLKKRGWKI
jgi:Arc/MetJ-type ribon-helix-helix transcriptional regulator